MQNQNANPATLARRLGFWSLVFYGVGDMLGSGIYALIGRAAKVMGNAVWLAFAVSLVAALLTGLTYASLGSRYPRAAGAAYITQRAFGVPYLSYVLGLVVVASGLTSLAVQARAFSGYLLGLLETGPGLSAVVALGFLLALSAVNFWGIRESSWFNILCTTIELSGLLVVVAVGARYLGTVDYLQTPKPSPASIPAALTPALVLQGAVLTFYSFVGFEDMLNVAEEVKNPRKTFPIAVVTALGITSLVYMAVAAVAVSVVDYRTLGISRAPLVDVVTKASAIPAWFFSLVALFAITNTGLLNYIMGSRMVYGMARQGLLPRKLGRVHEKRRTPHVAIFYLMLIVMVLALSGDIAQLAGATTALLMCAFVIVNAALIVLKRRPAEAPGAFEIPTLVPAGGIIVCSALLLFAQWRALLLAGVLVLAVSLLYLIMRPKNVVQDPE